MIEVSETLSEGRRGKVSESSGAIAAERASGVENILRVEHIAILLTVDRRR